MDFSYCEDTKHHIQPSLTLTVFVVARCLCRPKPSRQSVGAHDNAEKVLGGIIVKSLRQCGVVLDE